MLLLGKRVNQKVFSFVGDKLRGYKRFLRVKYIKEGITKEELYRLLVGQLLDLEIFIRSKGVYDTMWFGFVDMCFLEKFQVK